ncbi:MAG: hypothetical protein MJK12_04640 [Colwellia sp.]|nr:hypothetical protein [Colwellia sp.]
MQNSLSQVVQHHPISNDRRKSQPASIDAMWDELTLAQQFSISSLGQFGYTLSFIRNVNLKALAVLHLNDKTATINEEGAINITAGLDLRH